MNSDEVKWLEKLFEQHKEDQQKYLDAKFDSVATQLKDVKESVEDLTEDIDDVEAACVACIDELEEKTNKKIIIGSAGAVVAALLLWTAFGTNAIGVVLKWLSVATF